MPCYTLRTVELLVGDEIGVRPVSGQVDERSLADRVEFRVIFGSRIESMDSAGFSTDDVEQIPAVSGETGERRFTPRDFLGAFR
ncbi:MAG TPA: hypothetical protein VLC07_08155 [Solirubrobacterales bacterium]|nr:hypothetical protein [Solirubrobacterales bacterium]